jgi:hypothetical protein
MIKEKIKNEMGLLPVDRVDRSKRNYNNLPFQMKSISTDANSLLGILTCRLLMQTRSEKHYHFTQNDLVVY